jgi:hypothetical protein
MTNQQRTTLYLAIAVLSVVVIVCGGIGIVFLVGAKRSPGESFASASDLPQTNSRRFQGRTADDWGPELLDAHQPTSQDAAQALAQLGDEGCRWYRRGLDSEYSHVRLYSMARIPPAALVQYKGVFEPVHLRLAESDKDNIYPIAVNLSKMNSDRGKAIVERRAREEQHPNKRTALFETLKNWGR